MKIEEMDTAVFLIIIAGRKRKDALLSALSQAGACMTDTMYGKGTYRASCLADALGLVPEDKKVVITCILPEVRVDSILCMLEREFHFDRPNTGIAFTVPIDNMSV